MHHGQASKVRLFDPRVSQIFPRRQCLDESRCCCFLRGVSVRPAGCYVFTLPPLLYCTSKLTCEVVFFSTCRKNSHAQYTAGPAKQPPCSAWCKLLLLLLLGSSQLSPHPHPRNPHQPPPPSNSKSCSEKGPHPKFGRSPGGCFCVAHSFFLPPYFFFGCTSNLLMIKNLSDNSQNPHKLTMFNLLSVALNNVLQKTTFSYAKIAGNDFQQK